MNNLDYFKNQDCQYWLVQLGKLYYAGGLPRMSPINDSFSHEFVSDEALAFPFLYEEFAQDIAEQCGAIVIPRHSTVENYSALYDRHKKYINSEKEWHAEQQHAILEELKKAEHNG